jgi:hypothetical protein
MDDNNIQINEIKEIIDNITIGLCFDEYLPKHPYKDKIKKNLSAIP